MTPRVFLSGAFDDLRAPQIRLLEEASKLGALTVLLWSDGLVNQFGGGQTKFPEQERSYVLGAIRYVTRVEMVQNLPSKHALPEARPDFKSSVWAVPESEDDPAKRAFCQAHGLRYQLIPNRTLQHYPEPPPEGAIPVDSDRKKVIVTGCYDWLHSGHIRFFEEVSAQGALYVVLGHDANIRSLKGDGHPLYPQHERRYVVGAVRFVTAALIATGHGWLDAEPEMQRLHPDIYAVNEDGDKGGKREYCLQHRIQYLVLQRTPAPGLPRRSSTDLRGF